MADWFRYNIQFVNNKYAIGITHEEFKEAPVSFVDSDWINDIYIVKKSERILHFEILIKFIRIGGGN